MAVELIAKIKQKNNGTFKLVDACDVELRNGEDLQTHLDNINVKGGSSLICVYNNEISQDELDKNEIFIDKSLDNTLQGTINNISSAFINEIKTMFKTLQNTIDAQQTHILDLESRIRYLESLHNTVPDVSTSEAILLENGGYLLTENGGKIIMENSGKIPVGIQKKLLLENGGVLLLENGGVLKLENDESNLVNRLLTEDGNIFLLENGGHLLLENTYLEIQNGKPIIKLETGGDLLLENSGRIVVELSDDEYSLLLENGGILLNKKNGRIILE